MVGIVFDWKVEWATGSSSMSSSFNLNPPVDSLTESKRNAWQRTLNSSLPSNTPTFHQTLFNSKSILLPFKERTNTPLHPKYKTHTKYIDPHFTN
jgi:hypothetical protein